LLLLQEHFARIRVELRSQPKYHPAALSNTWLDAVTTKGLFIQMHQRHIFSFDISRPRADADNQYIALSALWILATGVPTGLLFIIGNQWHAKATSSSLQNANPEL
jgi:hypothetical protein